MVASSPLVTILSVISKFYLRPFCFKESSFVAFLVLLLLILADSFFQRIDVSFLFLVSIDQFFIIKFQLVVFGRNKILIFFLATANAAFKLTSIVLGWQLSSCRFFKSHILNEK